MLWEWNSFHRAFAMEFNSPLSPLLAKDSALPVPQLKIPEIPFCQHKMLTVYTSSHKQITAEVFLACK